MKGKFIIAGTLIAAVAFAGPAEAAKSDKKSKKAKAEASVSLTMDQFMALLQTLRQPTAQSQPGTPGADGKPGDRGPAGSAGSQGAAGSAGKPGDRGPAGEPGPAGEAGPAGERGPAGVGFSPGTIFLVNGGCPEGTTIQGPQNRWTVYANDTSGRPWLTTGSSAQLFLSACQVS